MSDEKIAKSMENLENALNRLGEALAESNEANKLAVDRTIQRFEFSVELFWKTLKRILFDKGVETHSPKDTLKKAFAYKWFDNMDLWLGMLNDRNQTSHIYNEDKALEIYNNIKKYHPEMVRLFEFLKKNKDEL